MRISDWSSDVCSSDLLAHTTIDLVTTLFASELDIGLEGANEPRRRLLSQIKHFIEANLDDDSLSPGQIAAAHYISVRQLHQLFQTEGSSVSTWIRTRRLEQCRRMLTERKSVVSGKRGSGRVDFGGRRIKKKK